MYNVVMVQPSSQLVIRDANRRDFLLLFEIDQECFEPRIAYTWSELLLFLRQPGTIAKVAETEGEVIGFAIGRVENRETGHIITLDVVPEARRRRVGSRLLLCLHEVFRSRGVALSVLEVDVRNVPALKFYEKLGYRRVETLRGYYAGSLDAFRMVCFVHPDLCKSGRPDERGI